MAPGSAFRNRKCCNKVVSKQVKNRQGLLKVPNSVLRTDNGRTVKEESSVFYPSITVAFKAIFSLRIVSAVWLHITDCDETYNYWEPLHYLLFHSGLQTWEYSPQYALRSYMYLLIHAVPAWIYNAIFQPSRLLLFYFIRCFLALFSAVAEVFFYKSVCREFGINVGRVMLVILIFSPGMFIASTAFLPSSFCMYMTCLSMGAWFHRKYSLSVLLTALSALVGWPFSAVIGLPIAYDMVIIRKKWLTFLKWSILSALIIMIPLIQLDSSYYGKFTIAPWNIIKYNIFTSHGANLYGTGPWYFYLFNGILNFNGCFIIALLVPFLLVWIKIVLPKKPRNADCLSYVLSLGTLYLWLIIFVLQSHKEERFLFPIYPLIALCGAVGIDAMQVLWYRYFIGKGSHYARSTLKLSMVIFVCYSTLGISRMFALYRGYHAPMDTFIELAKVDTGIVENEVNLCVGKEWHRFPSSFFLPDRWKLLFIRSEFDGLLPAYFFKHQDATKIERTDMNDLNKAELSRYVRLEVCDYLIDLDSITPTEREPLYFNRTEWTTIFSLPYLNAPKTPFYVRSFYVPVLWQSDTHFLSYRLLKRNKKIPNVSDRSNYN